MSESGPSKTLPEVLDLLREKQGADVTLALIDFIELPQAEKDEFVLRALLMLQRDFSAMHDAMLLILRQKP